MPDSSPKSGWFHKRKTGPSAVSLAAFPPCDLSSSYVLLPCIYHDVPQPQGPSPETKLMGLAAHTWIFCPQTVELHTPLSFNMYYLALDILLQQGEDDLIQGG